VLPFQEIADQRLAISVFRSSLARPSRGEIIGHKVDERSSFGRY
jgi:hypothetical protein